MNVRRSNPETNLEEELRGHFGEEEEESGSLLIEVSASGNAQCIQHPLCHLPYATDLQNTVTTALLSYTHYHAAFEKNPVGVKLHRETTLQFIYLRPFFSVVLLTPSK